MTHQQKLSSSNRARDKTNGSGKSKQNNFLKLSLPGLGFLRKFQQYRRLPQDAPGGSGHHLEEELDRLTGKIDNLLCKIEGQDQEAARGQEEECLVCGINRASMMTLPCSHQVVCRKCFVRTIQMAVAHKRLPLRCIMCRAKILKIKQNGGANGDHNTATSQQICDESDDGLPKSVSGYNINNNISYSGSSYSFTSGVSAVSSESTNSRKCSLTRDFSFSSLSNFQNVNLLDKSQIPRSKSSSFGSRRVRRSRSPSPRDGNRSKSAETGPPVIKIDRTPSEESVFSPSSPLAPQLSPTESLSRSSIARSPRSPTSPTNEFSFSERKTSRSSGRLSVSTPLSPIKESRKETESLAEFTNSPIKENKIQLAAAPKKQSSRIRFIFPEPKVQKNVEFDFRCTEKILTQLEFDAIYSSGGINDIQGRSTAAPYDKLNGTIGKNADIISYPENQSKQNLRSSTVKQSKSVTFKDC